MYPGLALNSLYSGAELNRPFCLLVRVKCGDYRHVMLCSGYVVLGIEPTALCLVGRSLPAELSPAFHMFPKKGWTVFRCPRRVAGPEVRALLARSTAYSPVAALAGCSSTEVPALRACLPCLPCFPSTTSRVCLWSSVWLQTAHPDSVSSFQDLAERMAVWQLSTIHNSSQCT